MAKNKKLTDAKTEKKQKATARKSKTIVAVSDEKYAAIFNLAMQKVLFENGFTEKDLYELKESFGDFEGMDLNTIFETYSNRIQNRKSAEELYNETIEKMSVVYFSDKN